MDLFLLLTLIKKILWGEAREKKVTLRHIFFFKQHSDITPQYYTGYTDEITVKSTTVGFVRVSISTHMLHLLNNIGLKNFFFFFCAWIPTWELFFFFLSICGSKVIHGLLEGVTYAHTAIHGQQGKLDNSTFFRIWNNCTKWHHVTWRNPHKFSNVLHYLEHVWVTGEKCKTSYMTGNVCEPGVNMLGLFQVYISSVLIITDASFEHVNIYVCGNFYSGVFFFFF